MAIVQAMCTSFKQEILEGQHDLRVAADAIKVALYLSAATLGAATTAYSVTNETSGAGYVAGGNTLTNVNPAIAGTTAFGDFANTTWAASTITARGALIYNSTVGNRAIIVLDFGVDKSSAAGDFTIQFPAADANNAIIRIA